MSILPVMSDILRALAALRETFDQQTETVERLSRGWQNELGGNIRWEGPAGDRFRSAWSEYEPALRRFEASVQEAEAEVMRRQEGIFPMSE